MNVGPHIPTVHILLATYQGQEYLDEQLESIARQSHTRWTLTISDDGSTDSTLLIAQRFAQRSPQPVAIIRGPRRGSTHNFLYLVRTAASENPADLYAFCDQDDFWLPEKLAAAVRHWQTHGAEERPYLYCGRIQTTDAELRPKGLSSPPSRPLTFGNALAQNIANGNTMVFNYRLLFVLRKICPEHAVWHDWSAYQAAAGCDGVIHYDHTPYVRYRQHGANVIGSRRALFDRLRSLLGGRYRRWGDCTELAMQDIADELSPQACHILDCYKKARHASGPLSRLRGAVAAGLIRQSRVEQVTFLAGIALGLV